MVVWVVVEEEVMVIVALVNGEGACRSRVAFCNSHFGIVVSSLGGWWLR